MSDEKFPPVGLITVWYRAGRDIERFASNLEALRYPNLQPTFVMNALEKHERALLESLVPDALVVDPGENLGCSAGWNRAIRLLLERETAFVGIWNVDVRVDPEYLRRLVGVMQEDQSIGACAPLLLYSHDPKRIQVYGGAMDVETGRALHEYDGWTDVCHLPAVRDARYLDGGTMLMRAQALQRVGAFDERYFMYYEDADLCLRMQSAGYRTVAVRDARAWHYQRELRGVLPAPHQLFYETRNRFYFVRKHAGVVAWRRLVTRTVLEMPGRTIHYLRLRRATLARAYLSGCLFGVLGWMGKRGWVE